MSASSKAGTKTIDQLIINSPYSEPAEHLKRDPQSKLFSRIPGRRSAGYAPARSVVPA